jgi:hypothetical protein
VTLDLLGKGPCRLLSAVIPLPGTFAGLPALWCVDPVEAYPLASDFNGVTIDDASGSVQFNG